jgi:hypothetical protein
MRSSSRPRSAVESDRPRTLRRGRSETRRVSVLAVELDVEHLLQRRDHVADQSRPSMAVNGEGDGEAASARF